eukprot:TRINITY_DN19734_c0_g1_i1.p1 TRINITY_DN19734_c0_g1~~TRINITY_DN19734_c0_g1_i1.p1  ORF type:complete len:810 (-),score=63.35 TRINITY_DN19734_c0_g1_i1:83-2215(-)
MGACRAFRNWRQDDDVFDWPWFKSLVTATVDKAVAAPGLFDLRPEDGPLSSRYRARWLRVYGFPGMKEALAFSDGVFENYREHHYRAGCHIGVISAYVLQLLPLHLRDTEGRLQRVAASVAQLTNLHAPFSHLIKTDWPLFRLLHLLSRVQRAPPPDIWSGSAQPRAPNGAARTLCSNVESAVVSLSSGANFIYVTAAEGPLAKFAGPVIGRWLALDIAAPLIFLALDAQSLHACRKAIEPDAAIIWCIDAPSRLGVEHVVAKYLSLAAIARLGHTAIWLDLDVFVIRDPSPSVARALSARIRPDIVFAKELTSESLVPSVVIARPLSEVVDTLVRYAYWLRDNPYLLDHQGWDQMLSNKVGDFAVNTDYKGRDVSIQDPKERPGPNLSFLPSPNEHVPKLRFAVLDKAYGSGDGWLGRSDGQDLALFHFWGAEESQSHLFSLLYSPEMDLQSHVLAVLSRYNRRPVAGPSLPAVKQSGPLYLVAVSYADGCCARSLKKNRNQALAVGADEARAYGRSDLEPTWAARHEHILSQRRGGGWWLWKPKLILQTLKDPAVPWNRGVVAWVDAGNFLHADPRPVIDDALRESDVAGMRLKLCLESDWTSSLTLQRLNASSKYAWTDRPQIGAYFLLFRKTSVAISFVEEWLRRSEDAETLLGGAAKTVDVTEIPGFQVHQADQSVLSILFKAHGFRALPLEEGHRVVTLARWRD